jgi:transmembrane sensor
MEHLKENSSIDQEINKSVWYYRVPARRSAEDALNIILKRIESGKVVQLSPSSSKFNLFKVSVSAAASFVLLVACYIYFATVSFKGSEQVSAIRLPDDSRVVLTQTSMISYKKYVWNRKVKLSGEAYFEVEKGGRFVVTGKTGIVRVLGTRFRVTDLNGSFSAECFEGKVNANLKGQEGHILTSGTLFADGKVKVVVENMLGKGYPGFAVFHKNYSGATLDQVFTDAEKFFSIKIKSSVSSKRQFSGTFSTGNPETAISIVCNALELNYKKAGIQYLISN